MYDKYATTGSLPPRIHIPDPPFTPDVANMILLDDSFTKPAMQPFNHIPIPEYTLNMRTLTEGRVQMLIEKHREQYNAAFSRTFDGSERDMEAALQERMLVMRAVFGSDSAAVYEDSIKPSLEGTAAPEETNTDAIMLAVVGILAEMSDVTNVQAWLAAGGLMPDVRHAFTEQDAQAGWEALIRADLGLSQSSFRRQKLPSVNPQMHKLPATNHRTPQVFPSHVSFIPWYQSPPHLLYWLRRGLIALDERGISVDFGQAPRQGRGGQAVEMEVDDEVA